MLLNYVKADFNRFTAEWQSRIVPPSLRPMLSFRLIHMNPGMHSAR